MKPLAIVNEYGNFDLAHNELPKRYVHVRGLRLQPLCRSLGIRYCDAVVRFDEYRSRQYTPIKDGVIISAASEAKLREAMAAREVRSEKAQHKKHEAAARKKEAYAHWLANLTVCESIVLGCDALFRLNRVAKLRSCADDRDEIYSFKNVWIRFLYGAGYCDRCVSHVVTVKEKRCFSCGGFGDDHRGNECDNCDGTGIFQPAGTIDYVLFSFDIEGTRYTWHQPAEYVNFRYELTETVSADYRPDCPKVGEMPANEMQKYLELLSSCWKRLNELGLVAPLEHHFTEDVKPD